MPLFDAADHADVDPQYAPGSSEAIRAGQPLGHGQPVPAGLLSDPDLSDLDRRILARILGLAGPKGMIASLGRTANELSVTRRHVRRRVSRMVALGFLLREERWKGTPHASERDRNDWQLGPRAFGHVLGPLGHAEPVGWSAERESLPSSDPRTLPPATVKPRPQHVPTHKGSAVSLEREGRYHGYPRAAEPVELDVDPPASARLDPDLAVAFAVLELAGLGPELLEVRPA